MLWINQTNKKLNRVGDMDKSNKFYLVGVAQGGRYDVQRLSDTKVIDAAFWSLSSGVCRDN